MGANGNVIGPDAGALAGGKRLKRVWRARILAEELQRCGFDATGTDEWNRVLVPLLKAKGIPDKFLREGVDVKVLDETEDGSFTLEFE